MRTATAREAVGSVALRPATNATFLARAHRWTYPVHRVCSSLSVTIPRSHRCREGSARRRAPWFVRCSAFANGGDDLHIAAMQERLSVAAATAASLKSGDDVELTSHANLPETCRSSNRLDRFSVCCGQAWEAAALPLSYTRVPTEIGRQAVSCQFCAVKQVPYLRNLKIELQRGSRHGQCSPKAAPLAEPASISAPVQQLRKDTS